MLMNAIPRENATKIVGKEKQSVFTHIRTAMPT